MAREEKTEVTGGSDWSGCVPILFSVYFFLLASYSQNMHLSNLLCSLLYFVGFGLSCINSNQVELNCLIFEDDSKMI